MFARIALVFVGFASGLLTVAVLDYFLLPDVETEASEEPPTEFPLDAEAYTDTSQCSTASAEAMLGTWAGEAMLPSGIFQRWTMTRAANGTYSVAFRWFDAGKEVHSSEESGYWSYSGCLLTTVALMVDSVEVLNPEVYRVHAVEDDYARYSHFRTGQTYEQRRSSETLKPTP